MSNRRIQDYYVELRSDGDTPGFSGHASHFWSVDSYYTAIKPGAFRKTIRERGTRIPVLYQHDANRPIGRLAELKEDKDGLYFDASIVDATRDGAEAMALLRGDVPLGMSFGFQTMKARQATKDDPLDFSQVKAKPEEVMVIEEVKLWEVSLVTFAANHQADIADIRSAAEADAITTLTERIRRGDLEDDQRALVADLVAAFGEHEPEPGEPTPLGSDSARRKMDMTLAAVFASQCLGGQ